MQAMKRTLQQWRSGRRAAADAGERPPMPPMPPMEETAEIFTESGERETSSGEEALLAQLSQAFRANEDSILATMEEA